MSAGPLAATPALASVRNVVGPTAIQTFSVFDSTTNRDNSPRQDSAILRDGQRENESA
jgi:hypothetical protein